MRSLQNDQREIDALVRLVVPYQVERLLRSMRRGPLRLKGLIASATGSFNLSRADALDLVERWTPSDGIAVCGLTARGRSVLEAIERFETVRGQPPAEILSLFGVAAGGAG